SVEAKIADLQTKIAIERKVKEGASTMLRNLKDKNAREQCEVNIMESQRRLDFMEGELRKLQSKLTSSPAGGSSPGHSREGSNSYGNGGNGNPWPTYATQPRSTSLATSSSVLDSLMTTMQQNKRSGPGASLSLPRNAAGSSLGPTSMNTLERVPETGNETPATPFGYLETGSALSSEKVKYRLNHVKAKLDLEQKVKAGTENLLMAMHRNRADSKQIVEVEAKLQEVREKISFLSKAEQKYAKLNVADEEEEEQLGEVRQRRTGRLRIRLIAALSIPGKRTSDAQFYAVIRVDGQRKATSRPTRQRWDDHYDIQVDKAQQVEITIYDTSYGGGGVLSLVWFKLSELEEDLKTKFGPEWGKMSMQDLPETWLDMEPDGRLLVKLQFVPVGRAQTARDMVFRRDPVQKVFPRFGHKFVAQQLYQVMQCAVCNEFLTGTAYQCSICNYACHPKCYERVITRCVTKRKKGEDDNTSQIIKYNIPHRFETTTNLGATWCCHCGYMLPMGVKNILRCSECSTASHRECMHMVPNFCGLSPDMANTLVAAYEFNERKMHQKELEMEEERRKQQLAEQMQQQQEMMQQQRQQEVQQQQQQQRYERPPSPPSKYGVPQDHQHHHHPPPSAVPSVAPTVVSLSSQSHQNQLHHEQQQLAQQLQQLQLQLHNDPNKLPPQSLNKKPAASAGNVEPAPSALRDPFMQKQKMHQQQAVGGMVGAPSPHSSKDSVAPPPAKPKRELRLPTQATKVGLEDFHFLAVLGRGAFGKVMLATEKTTKHLYAIKALKKEFIIQNDDVKSTKLEKRIFQAASTTKHPFLVNLHSCFQTGSRVYFVMEYVSGGDLMCHIQEKRRFSPARTKFYACEVLLAVEYFHKNNIIYRDLKLDNILMTPEGHIKVADYGICKEDMPYGSTTRTFCGTPDYMAPEILQNKRYGRAVDWWSFGVLIYVMLFGKYPFHGEDEYEILDTILADAIEYPPNMPRDTLSLLQGLLNTNPAKRLGGGRLDAEEIKRHRYFVGVDWQAFLDKRVKPPWKPTISSPTDVSNFDKEFTSEQPVLTPIDSVLSQTAQEEFADFNFVSDWAQEARAEAIWMNSAR
ncbi:Serine/threonine kinase, partial [Quaeritorhiza haematococci]